MGVRVTIHDDRPDRYPSYLGTRAWKRSGVEFDETTWEEYERGLLRDGQRVSDAGYDPSRFYQILGYELDAVPEMEAAVADAFAIPYDSRRVWDEDEVAWMSEACYEAGIERLASVCYTAIVLERTVRSNIS